METTINRRSKNASGTVLDPAILLCLTMGTLLVLRAVNSLFFWPAMLLGIATVIFANVENAMCLLFFTLPLSQIFKLGFEQMSIFSVMFILFTMRMLFTKKINITVFLLSVAFAAYLILFSGIGQIATIVSIICGIFLLYYFQRENIDLSKIVIAFSFGIIVASALSLLREQLPLIDEIILTSKMKLSNEEYATRFAGLHGNPNYYTLDINIVLAAVSIFMFTKKKKAMYVLLFGALSFFGFLSVSKSFLAAWIIMMVLIFFFSIQYKSSGFLFFVFLILLCLFCVYIFAADTVNLYLVRFISDADDMSVSHFTTGRTEIWSEYLLAIFSDIKLFMVGNGIGGEMINDRGAHNAYLDLMYLVGIIGSVMFMVIVAKCMKNDKQVKKRKLILYIPLLIFLVRSMAIGLFTYDSLFFYLILVVGALKYNVDEGENVNEKNHRFSAV